MINLNLNVISTLILSIILYLVGGFIKDKSNIWNVNTEKEYHETKNAD